MFLECFVRLDSCRKVCSISPQVPKFLNPLSKFSMFPQSALIFLQVAFLDPFLQKVIFLSLNVRFSNSLVAITRENDMLSKVSLLFFFNLPVAASLLIITKTLLLSCYIRIFLFWGRIFATLQNSSLVSMTDHMERASIFLNLVTKQFNGFFLWFGLRNEVFPKLFNKQLLILLLK